MESDILYVYSNVLGLVYVSELMSCVNREVGPGSHSLSHSSPVPINHEGVRFVSVDVKRRGEPKEEGA